METGVAAAALLLETVIDLKLDEAHETSRPPPSLEVVERPRPDLGRLVLVLPILVLMF